MESNKKNALFIQRVGAFILDIIIVSIISSLLYSPFVKTESIDKLNKQASDVAEKYMAGKTNINTYLNQSMDISYEMSRISGVSTIIQIAILILYFIVFQFYNKGQTLGKKLMKIMVINSDEDNELTMNNFIIRSLIINSIFINMVILGFTIFAGKDIYFFAVAIFEGLEYLIIIISAFMMIFSSDGKGIHDRLAHTRVVRIG